MQHQEKRLLFQSWEMEASDQAAVKEQGLGQMLSFKSWTKMGTPATGLGGCCTEAQCYSSVSFNVGMGGAVYLSPFQAEESQFLRVSTLGYSWTLDGKVKGRYLILLQFFLSFARACHKHCSDLQKYTGEKH